MRVDTRSRILEGKTLVTGAASDIGRATALLFAREGASVLLTELSEGAGHEVPEGRAIFEGGDVAYTRECQRVVAVTVREFGNVQILFHTAGIIRCASVFELSEEDWDWVMNVNTKSIFLMSREVIPVMVKAGGGSMSLETIFQERKQVGVDLILMRGS